MKIYIKAAVVNVLDEDADVQAELAENPNTSSDILTELSESSYSWVRARVLLNPNVDTEILIKLINAAMADRDDKLLTTVARNTGLDESIFDMLADYAIQHPSSFLAIPLATNPSAPENTLFRLLDYDTHAHAVTDPIIDHPNVTLNVLRKLLIRDNGYCHYMKAIANRHHLPDEFLWEFARNGCDADKRNIANIDYVPSEILEYLIETCPNIQYGYIRSDAISNPNLSVDALYQLADNPKNLDAIIKNPNCPSDILTQAADYCISKEDLWNLDYVAMHPNTPIDVMYDIFEYSKNYNRIPQFLEGLASNPNIPTEIARQLLLKDDRVKEALAKNNNVDPEILASLVKGKVAVRKALAKNPNTPTKILMKLAKDRSDSVLYAVADNPNLPEDIFILLMERYQFPWWLKRQLKRFPQYADRFN